jgi:hypothetical protein
MPPNSTFLCDDKIITTRFGFVDLDSKTIYEVISIVYRSDSPIQKDLVKDFLAKPELIDLFATLVKQYFAATNRKMDLEVDALLNARDENIESASVWAQKTRDVLSKHKFIFTCLDPYSWGYCDAAWWIERSIYMGAMTRAFRRRQLN